ncbi:c-type cytochrome [Bradyrhizobium sp. C9]|uniref:c-type cytochrome n=1 Tax=Bradyrhizobium sp. C9 TaxID=142585 RepID=UPI001FE22941|nr:c-type cytochrome [Bradyrhizobium sp. C9]
MSSFGSCLTMIRAAILAAALSMSLPVASRAGELQAKLDYCKTCHGLSGQGYRGYFPMPRLAGQQQEYLENQLRAFVERRRINPIMANVAHALSPSMVSGLSSHFQHLNPKPIGGAPSHSSPAGRQIFNEGLPEANVPACSACHGSDGHGQNEIPRLAGQLYEYMVGQLTGWSKVRGQGTSVDTSAVMAPTAHNMSRSQIEAVAAYVSTLP